MKKKTSKQKGVLAASVLLAGVIVAGGTFAWFTSQDKVVNQLSASNDYDVAITESFKSPKSWIPGQKVEKLVSAVNTGSVDAFVKMSVTNSMDLTKLSSVEYRPEQKTGNQSNADEIYSDVYNYVTLSTKSTTSTDNKTESTTKTEDEVTSLQAGGVLAGAWYYDSTAASGKEWTEITTGTTSQVSIVGTKGTDFKPSVTGLYLFKRDQEDTTTTTTTQPQTTTTTRTYTYVGYYYVQNARGEEETKDTPGNGTYYALSDVLTETDKDITVVDEDGYFLTAAAQNVCKRVKYQTTTTTTVTPILEYVAAEPAVAASDEPKTAAKDATPAYIKATYDPDGKYGTTESAKDDTTNNIVININLSAYADGWNTAKDVKVADTTDDTWTYIGSTDSNSKLTPTFYYNKLVAAGTTSDALIDSITLDSSVTEDAYYSFDYNLAILLDSVQVTDKDGKQSNDAVVSNWTEVTSALTMDTNDTTKISTIAWTAVAAK